MTNTLSLAKLKGNPFTLVPGEKVTVWAGYPNLRQTLLDIVESCRSDKVGLSEFVILHGEIGSGKSHALRYLENWITEVNKTEYESQVVYFKSLKLAAKMDFVALYRRAIELLLDHVRETAEWLDLVIEETVTAGNNLREAAIKEGKDKRYHDSTIVPSFPALPLLLRGIKNNEEDAIKILFGQSDKGLAKYGLTTPIDNEFSAVNCLGAYINLCTRGTAALSQGETLGRNKAFYFFLDEIEMLQDFKPAEVVSINQGLRDLINACPENCCFLFGMTGDTRNIFALFDQHVMRRMSRDPLEIHPLADDQALTFLKEVLKSYRADPADPDEYPFREDALRKIAEETQEKTAAGLFRSCRRVLEKAVLQGRLQPDGWIEVQDVQDFL
ncbi:MAG: hypothetical protein QOH70_1467 [Blastocatellia bacterium]|jgi:hypothetical protein|nr:hypothetical protein [Blastocatellia bacterium]